VNAKRNWRAPVTARWRPWIDASDLAVVLGLALLSAGLWLTVGWWALVVLGALLLALGVAAALKSY
jgi:hypothetical protein